MDKPSSERSGKADILFFATLVGRRLYRAIGFPSRRQALGLEAAELYDVIFHRTFPPVYSPRLDTEIPRDWWGI